MSDIIRFRTLFPVMAIITILILLSPILLGLAFAVFTYDGVCYGFTDGSWNCTRQEFISNQVFWSVWLDVPLGIFLIASWAVALGLWLYHRRTSADGLPILLVIAIPMGGGIGGFSFMSLFSIYIRYFIGF